MPDNKLRSPLTKGGAWASAALFALVAFEFFYMVSPFAAYIYTVYGPALSWLRLNDTTTWLVAFFMPHIVRDTGSLLLDWHEPLGATLFIGGAAGFLLGAIPIYWTKLTRRRAVTSGVYRFIRHPQYLALMVASAGMLLLWPRYLVVVTFVTVCAAYILLARVEERACERDFPEYREYMASSGMFLPRWMESRLALVRLPARGAPRLIAGAGLYIGLLALGLAGARLLHLYAVSSLHTYATERAVYVALGDLDSEAIANLARLAVEHEEVRRALDEHDEPGARFINYVMPTTLHVSEVPMHIPDDARVGHEKPGSHAQERYKIVFTRAHFGASEPSAGRSILLSAVNKSPVVEVWLDRPEGRVERVLRPDVAPYFGLPVPVF